MDDAMLDNPEKTTRLLAALKAAAPFGVELAPSLIEICKPRMLPMLIRRLGFVIRR
jgi:hypothetical protein